MKFHRMMKLVITMKINIIEETDSGEKYKLAQTIDETVQVKYNDY